MHERYAKGSPSRVISSLLGLRDHLDWTGINKPKISSTCIFIVLERLGSHSFIITEVKGNLKIFHV